MRKEAMRKYLIFLCLLIAPLQLQAQLTLLGVGSTPGSSTPILLSFDNAQDLGNNGGTTNSQSGSYTATGTNLIGLVLILGDQITGSDDISSVTWGGVSCSLLRAYGPVLTGSDRFMYVYYILSPATGSQTIAVTAASTHYLIVGAASYAGARQSAQPDNTTTNVSGSTGDTTLTTSLTTVANNSWTFVFESGFTSGNTPPAAGTNSTRRTFGAAFGNWGFFDSNGPVTPAGSFSMTTTRSSGLVGISHIMFSIKPHN